MSLKVVVLVIMVYKRKGYILKISQALTGVAQWIEHRPMNPRVASSIPSQGTCLAYEPGPQ